MPIAETSRLCKACCRRPALVLVMVCLLLFLPGFFTLPPLDRDEARFAQAARQMIESGDYIDIRFQDEARYKKPIGIYWLQAGAVQALERIGGADRLTVWAYRLPSLIGALLAALALWGLLRPVLGGEGALIAALMLAASLILTVEARLAKTDAMLTLCFVVMFGALAQAYARFREGFVPTWGAVALFWVGMAASVLLKGPVGPVVAGLALVSLRLWWKERGFFRALRPWWGVLFVALLALPWFLAIQAKSGGAFMAESVGHDFIGKLLEGQESHGKPPGFYLLLLPLLIWPFAPLVLRQLPHWPQLRAEPLVRLALAWTLPGWLVFELVPTKLPHYVLPFLPAIVAAAALAWTRPPAGGFVPGARGLRGYAAFGLALWFVVCLALAGAAVALPLLLEGRFSLWSIPVVIGALLVLGTGWTARDAEGMRRFLCAGTLGAVLVYAGVLQGVLPGLRDPWLSRTVADAVTRHGGGQLATTGYREPSLIFLVGTETVLTSPEGAALFLRDHPDGLALVASDGLPVFADAAAAEGVRVEELEQITGFNYSKGDWVRLVLYRRVPQ
jgi:4-amino-4-deoxy-L-arabinose transferase-like glycosyltransferase